MSEWDGLLQLCYSVRSEIDWVARNGDLSYQDQEGQWKRIAIFQGNEGIQRAQFCAAAYEYFHAAILEIQRLTEELAAARGEDGAK